MKLSTRTRYGIRAILELAEYYGNGPLQLRVIAHDQGVSVKYLEQLMAMLKARVKADSSPAPLDPRDVPKASC